MLDILIPDLPGEWSDALIDTNRTERLAFAEAADVIWLFVNGKDLRDPRQRMHTLSRTKRLLQRICGLVGDTRPPIKIVVSHADAGALPDSIVAKLREISDNVGVSAELIEIASFSAVPHVMAAGHGIATLIDRSIPTVTGPQTFWNNDIPGSGRFNLRYEGPDCA